MYVYELNLGNAIFNFNIILQRAELHRITSARKSELEYLQSTNELEISKKQKMADIESTRFKCMVEELGPLNIAAIATSGKDNQVLLIVE